MKGCIFCIFRFFGYRLKVKMCLRYNRKGQYVLYLSIQYLRYVLLPNPAEFDDQLKSTRIERSLSAWQNGELLGKSGAPPLTTATTTAASFVTAAAAVMASSWSRP